MPDLSAMLPPRILIVRLSALGDVIHTLPLLAALRRRWPEAYLGWLVEPGARPLLEDHPLLDRLHVVPRRAWKTRRLGALRREFPALVRELREERYDIALDAQGLTKSALWPWLAGVPRRIGLRRPDARELAPQLATELVSPPPGERHVIRRTMALLGPLGLDPLGPVTFPVHLAGPARAAADAILGEEESPLALLNPGAGWATKIWPPERYGELARRLADRGYRVAIAWGPGEQPLVLGALAGAGAPASDFAHRALPPGPGIAALPATSFLELGAVVARARLYVGGDTGPTHLAAALGVPTLCLMGPLDARRNGPFGAHARTLQHAVPRRAPFWRNHRRWCDPRTELGRIGVDEVAEAAFRMLEESAEGARI